MSLKNLCLIIDESCYKVHFTQDEYIRITSTCSLVNSTTLYRWYKQLGGTVSYKEFYPKLKELFYYDKYVCTHGTEYMYYIMFRNGGYRERIPKDVIEIIRAIGG